MLCISNILSYLTVDGHCDGLNEKCFFWLNSCSLGGDFGGSGTQKDTRIGLWKVIAQSHFLFALFTSLSFLLLPPCLLLTSMPPKLDVLLSLWKDMPNISFCKLHWSWCLITAAKKQCSSQVTSASQNLYRVQQ